MNAPWMNHKFNSDERERMNEIEDWSIEHEDEIAPRIVYLESLIKNLTDSFNLNLKSGDVAKHQQKGQEDI